MKIPFHRPIIPNDLGSIFPETIQKGWITTGPQVKIFESRLSEYLNAEHVVAVNSCTAALHLALAAMDFKKGDRFIVPTYTFVASIEVGEYLSMEPILIDCEENGFKMDLNKVEDVLKKEKNIKAIIPVHFAGETLDANEVSNFADIYGLFVLDDAAHALESKSIFGKVGNTDHAAAFSFYANKNMTTGGEGGALSTNNGEFAEKIRKLSLHGMSKDGWKRFQNAGNWAYDVSELGFKYNMTDMAASFGLWQLERIEEWFLKRLEIVKRYQSELSHIDGLICPINPTNIKHALHLYVIRIKPNFWKISRNELIDKLNENGISTSVHYIPVHMHSYYKNKYGFKPNDFPIATELTGTVITLPLYPALKLSEVQYIISVLKSLWKENIK